MEGVVTANLVETSLMQKSGGVDMTVHKGDLLRPCPLQRHCCQSELSAFPLGTVVFGGRDASHNLIDYFLELLVSSLSDIIETSSLGSEVRGVST